MVLLEDISALYTIDFCLHLPSSGQAVFILQLHFGSAVGGIHANQECIHANRYSFAMATPGSKKATICLMSLWDRSTELKSAS